MHLIPTPINRARTRDIRRHTRCQQISNQSTPNPCKLRRRIVNIRWNGLVLMMQGDINGDKMVVMKMRAMRTVCMLICSLSLYS
jgi:hypothetical protein